MFYRKQSPKFTERDVVIFVDMIKELVLMFGWIFVAKNDKPCDMCDGVEVMTDHRTVWYDLTGTSLEEVENYRQRFLRLWYSIEERSDEHKSINIPHFHAIRIRKAAHQIEHKQEERSRRRDYLPH